MQEATNNQKIPERRKHLRNPIIVLKLAEESERNYFFGQASQISRGGLLIESLNPRKPGERSIITFQIPDTAIKVRCQCEVVWTRSYHSKSKMQPGYGIRFLDLPEPVAAAIDEWVISQVSADPPSPTHLLTEKAYVHPMLERSQRIKRFLLGWD